AQWCDHLLCIHAFEQPFYERWGLPTTVIGNPALQRLPKGDGGAFRKRYSIAVDAPVVGLLPGSRRSEIRRVAPALFEAAGRAAQKDSRRTIVCMVAPSVAADVDALAKAQPRFLLIRDETEKADAFAAMDVALACSGTVTTELASQ